MTNESTHLHSRGLYITPHQYHRHQQTSHRSKSAAAHTSSRLDSGRHHQQVSDGSFRYVDAQIRNKTETLKLNELRQALDRQRRETTMIIERNKRRFAEEMADVDRTTSDLAMNTVPVPRHGVRQRAATAGARRHVFSSYDQDDVDSGIAPSLAVLQLYERDTQQRWIKPTVNRTTEMRSRRFAAPRRVFPARSRDSQQADRMSAARVCHSAGGRSTGSDQCISVKQTPVFTTAGRPGASSYRSSEVVHTSRPTSSTHFAAAATADPDDAETGNSSTRDGSKVSSSNWRRDLKWEAPPALFGYRRSLSFNVAMSRAERRRRLAGLQSRQMAPLVVRPNGVTCVKRVR